MEDKPVAFMLTKPLILGNDVTEYSIILGDGAEGGNEPGVETLLDVQTLVPVGDQNRQVWSADVTRAEPDDVTVVSLERGSQ